MGSGARRSDLRDGGMIEIGTGLEIWTGDLRDDATTTVTAAAVKGDPDTKMVEDVEMVRATGTADAEMVRAIDGPATLTALATPPSPVSQRKQPRPLRQRHLNP